MSLIVREEDRLEAVEGKKVKALLQLLDQKCPATRRHCQRVARMARDVARFAAKPEPVVRSIHTSALLHDVGKIFLPDSILTKEQDLTDGEYYQIKFHCRWGQEILMSTPGMQEQASVALYHHERWNGGGYPNGLAGNEIPYEARLIHLLDALDVMLWPRIYKDAYPLQWVLSEIQQCRGEQFDPVLVDLTMEWIRKGGLETSIHVRAA